MIKKKEISTEEQHGENLNNIDMGQPHPGNHLEMPQQPLDGYFCMASITFSS